MKLSVQQFILIVTMLLSGMAGCIKKEEFSNVKLPDWTPSEAAPLINSSLTLKDIVASTKANISEDPSGLYSFIYRDTVDSPVAEDIIQLPDQSASTSVGVTSVEITPFPAGKTITKSSDNSFSFNVNYGAGFKYIELKGGTFAISLSSKFRHNVTLNVVFKSLTVNGVPLSRTYNLNYAGAVPVTLSDNIDLAGVTVDLSGDGTTTNQFDYSVTCAITSTGNPISTLDALSINLDLKSLRYSLLVGDMGSFPISPYDGQMDLNVFDRTLFGDLYFERPKLTLTFDNSFGVPVTFTVNKLQAVTTGNQVLPITSSQLSSPVSLNYPAMNAIGQSETTIITLDKDNSNIRDALNPAPNEVDFSIQTTIGASGTTDRFITDKSRIRVYVEAELPLDGRVHVYALEDTSDVNMPDSKYVEKASLKIKATNGFPIDMKLQVYFLDSLGQMLDSLIVPPNDIAVSGQLDAQGKVIAPTEKYTEISMDKQEYEKIAHAAKVILKGELVTSNNATTSVKIYSFYSLRIQLSLLADLKVKLQ